MALVLCPECRAEVSDRAAHCPRCGYPIGEPAAVPAVRAPGAKPPRLRTFVSPRFAGLWTLAVGVAGLILIASAAESGEDVGVVGGFMMFATAIPLWWKTRRAALAQAAAGNPELERRVEERLQAAEEQVRRRLGELEDSSRQIMDLEERIDFAERLLTKYRDDQAP